MCIDYRALNVNTIINAYPIPCIDDILDCLQGSVIFSKIDLAQGYHQVRIAKGHEYRTAFQMCFRLFEYCILSLFGLCNAPATFQRLMHKILLSQSGCFLHHVFRWYSHILIVYCCIQKQHLSLGSIVIENCLTCMPKWKNVHLAFQILSIWAMFSLKMA